ncbi:hypothetical protein AAVH_27386 [Aphelenchoides avenae]|nr:hypothetical protein AAVH_27386 [Aphelenchus avenae]
MGGLAKAVGALKDDDDSYFIQCNAKLAADPNFCIFNVYASDLYPGFFSVGAALARKYCLVFNYDNVQLGLSENLCPPVSG